MAIVGIIAQVRRRSPCKGDGCYSWGEPDVAASFLVALECARWLANRGGKITLQRGDVEGVRVRWLFDHDAKKCLLSAVGKIMIAAVRPQRGAVDP
jgi:hypothetical protein